MSSRNGKLWLLKNVPLTKDQNMTFGVDAFCPPYTIPSPYYTENGGVMSAKASDIRRWQFEWFTDSAEWTGQQTNDWVYRFCDNRMYTRLSSNTLKVNLDYNVVFDCNYLILQQPDMLEGRYIYAFVNNVEYIQDNVSSISFEIDVMQTFLPNIDYTFNEIFIERETVDDDTFGKHTVNEGLEVGDYIIRNVSEFRPQQPLNAYDGNYTCRQGIGSLIVVGFATEELTTTQPTGGYFNNSSDPTVAYYKQPNIMPSTIMPLYWAVLGEYNSPEIEQSIKNYISNYASKKDAIIAIAAIPSYCFGQHNEVLLQAKISQRGVVSDENYFIHNVRCEESQQPAGENDLTETDTAPVENGGYGARLINSFNVPELGDSYDCINQKCRIYPYTKILLTTDASEIELRYERFDSPLSAKSIGVRGLWSIEPRIMAYPENYNNRERAYDYAISLTGFPQLAWSSDAFANWFGQNAGTLAASAVASGLQIFLGAAQASSGVGATVGLPSILSGVAGFAKIIGSGFDASAKPDTLENNYINRDILSGYMESAPNSYKLARNFRCYAMSVRDDVLKTIDDYFSKYGYKVNKIAIPTLHNRKLWDYIKSNNSKINISSTDGKIFIKYRTLEFDLRQITISRDVNSGMTQNYQSKIQSVYNEGITIWHTPNGNELGKYLFKDNKIMSVKK